MVMVVANDYLANLLNKKTNFKKYEGSKISYEQTAIPKNVFIQATGSGKIVY
jgi:hypothetical protein